MNLVTGATGIVGSHVVLALLRSGREVIACKQGNSDLSKVKALFAYYSAEEFFNRIRWVEVDIRDIFSIEAALEGVTNVYHCAGFVSFHGKDRKKLIAVNETGTKNVVDACLHKNTAALCYVSTIGTINNLDYASDLTEEVFWKRSGKESDYAISKYNAEREVWRGMEEGLNAVIVNPGIILAPGFWGQSSSRLFEASYQGNRFYTNGLSAYVAATDVADIMTALMDRKLFGQRYILVENNYTFLNILSHIQSCFHRPAPSVEASRPMLALAGFFERIFSFFSGKERRITKALSNSAFNRQLYSNRKIRETLGFSFKPTHQVIEEICSCYLSQKEQNPD